MIWFAWRQFRTQTWIAAGMLAVLGVLLVFTSRTIADAYAAAGLDACDPDCTSAIEGFLTEVSTGTPGLVYNFVIALIYVMPALIGAFWGAPLIARELETGTHRLAWNQSITRTRWLATKLALIGLTVAAVTGVLSLVVSIWAQRIDTAADDRITPLVYGARGIVPIGYALFAFVLGVAVGMIVRRTVAAMAATLAGYAAAAAIVPLLIREHLVPATHVNRALDTSSIEELMINSDNANMEVYGGDLPAGAWVVSNQTLTAAGDVFNGPADPQFCGPQAPFRGCEEWIGTLSLRQELTYHPASNFWPLQLVETGILVAAAALLAGFCFWWLRRRLA